LTLCRIPYFCVCPSKCRPLHSAVWGAFPFVPPLPLPPSLPSLKSRLLHAVCRGCDVDGCIAISTGRRALPSSVQSVRRQKSVAAGPAATGRRDRVVDMRRRCDDDGCTTICTMQLPTALVVTVLRFTRADRRHVEASSSLVCVHVIFIFQLLFTYLSNFS